MNKPHFVWLVSYPKSGNTWIRIFLANYLSKNRKKVSINDIKGGFISSSRELFDLISPLPSSDLNFDEVDVLRPLVYKKYNEELEQEVFVKTHDAYTLNTNQKPIFPEEITLATIYIVRNPFDVAVSFANHLSVSTDRIIDIMNDSDYAFAGKNDSLPKQLRQTLKSWSEHFYSWKKSPFDIHLLKYEDLHTNPLLYFGNMVRFIYGNLDKEQLEWAVNQSSFKKLKHEEQNGSFKEKPIKSSSFFRKGIIGDGIEQLTDKQKYSLYEHHKQLIEELGYNKMMK